MACIFVMGVLVFFEDTIDHNASCFIIMVPYYFFSETYSMFLNKEGINDTLLESSINL